MQPGTQLPMRRFIACRQHLDATVSKIDGMPRHIECPSLLTGAGSEEHTLHPTGDPVAARNDRPVAGIGFCVRSHSFDVAPDKRDILSIT